MRFGGETCFGGKDGYQQRSMGLFFFYDFLLGNFPRRGKAGEGLRPMAGMRGLGGGPWIGPTYRVSSLSLLLSQVPLSLLTARSAWSKHLRVNWCPYIVLDLIFCALNNP